MIWENLDVFCVFFGCILFFFYVFSGVSYGFHVMRDHESPNVPFTLIRTRFVQGKVL